MLGNYAMLADFSFCTSQEHYKIEVQFNFENNHFNLLQILV